MCKNWENGAKWTILRKSTRATSAGLRSGLRVRELACALAGVRQRHGPIARGPGGVARSLRCGTVSNAFVLLSPV